jgi:DNA-binding NarL/FixJ family response regulator
MSKATILIVEDEEIIAADLASRLRHFGYEVRGQTAYAETAVELVRTLHPDLVLMDICLRGQMNGLEAAALIRQESNVPLIFLTSYLDRTTLERSTLANSFNYNPKPFDEYDLMILIQKVLRHHHNEQILHQATLSQPNPSPDQRLKQERKSACRLAKKTIRVLLVDDHPAIRLAMSQALQEQTDFKVVGTASNGCEAIDLVRILHPDVVLMDVNMPLMNGIEATRRIMAESPHMKVIGLSNSSEQVSGQAMRQAGAVDYLDKSQRLTGVMEAIRKLVGDRNEGDTVDG